MLRGSQKEVRALWPGQGGHEETLRQEPPSFHHRFSEELDMFRMRRGEISSAISEYELLQFFEQFGAVETCQLARDPRSVAPRVEIPDVQLQER